MLRIRNEARVGLRGVAFGFVAAVFTLSSHAAQCAPYADIVVDANTGNVLHATNPDALRHPASLTKIMTLYMLFEQLEAGTLKLDSKLKVSEFAAGQSPTKLGLRPGSTIQVEDAIKGIVTRSANDAAVVVAEAIADNEQAFAKLMTGKAQALGMSRTVYRNASGLPNDEQITTARDQAILGRAIQERFPRYYKYFSTRLFTFRGNSIGNHNNLLGRVEGVDGIKTGYTQASGFNLVTSVHRGNRYVVAVVLGGNSASSRDARMRELISEKMTLASVKRTAPTMGDGSDAPETKVATAKVETKPQAKAEPKPEQKAAAPSGFGLASAHSEPVRFTPTSEPTPARAAPARAAMGSTEPIRPVLVKTLMVHTLGTQAASLAPTLLPTTSGSGQSPAASAPKISALMPNAEPVVEPKAEARVEPENDAQTEPPVAASEPPSRLLEPVQVIPAPDSAPAAPASEAKGSPPVNELKTVAPVVSATSSFTRGPALPPSPKVGAPATAKSEPAPTAVASVMPSPPSVTRGPAAPPAPKVAAPAPKSEPAPAPVAPVAKSEPAPTAVASMMPSPPSVTRGPAAPAAPKVAAAAPKSEPAPAPVAPVAKSEPAPTAVASMMPSPSSVARGPATPPAPKVAAPAPKSERAPTAATPVAKSEPAPTAVASAMPSPPSVTRGPATPPAPKVAAPAPKSEPAPAPVAPVAKSEPAPPSASVAPTTSTFTRGPAGPLPQRFTAPAPKGEPGPMAFATVDPTPAPFAAPSVPATKPQARSGWIIQVGAYPAEQEAKQRLSVAQNKASKILTHADPFTETVDKGGTTLYRARFAGLDKDSAEAACKYLKRNDVDCVAIKN
jgi:D-alanyl-D-alanine carboxypeptidase